MARSKKAAPAEVRDLGLFETNHTDQPNVKALAPWSMTGTDTIYCDVRLRGTPSRDAEDALPFWRLRIRRPRTRLKDSSVRRTAKFFLAQMADVIEGYKTGEWSEPILQGHCTGWVDAIRQVEVCAPIADYLRQLASSVYGAANAHKWELIRPFKVVWPFREPERGLQRVPTRGRVRFRSGNRRSAVLRVLARAGARSPDHSAAGRERLPDLEPPR